MAERAARGLTTALPHRMNRAVFLDRDGTLIVDKDYLRRPEEVELLPGVKSGLERLHQARFLLFIITNQSGIGRGLFSMTDVENVHRYLGEQLGPGAPIKKIYIAPERPDEPARGRKPSPRFLFDARDEFEVDLSQSYLIGDKFSDLECGWNAGVQRSLLVRTGYGAEVEERRKAELERALVFDDLNSAIEWILRQEEGAKIQPRP